VTFPERKKMTVVASHGKYFEYKRPKEQENKYGGFIIPIPEKHDYQGNSIFL
jgi:hypothetical protein